MTSNTTVHQIIARYFDLDAEDLLAAVLLVHGSEPAPIYNRSTFDADVCGEELVTSATARAEWRIKAKQTIISLANKNRRGEVRWHATAIARGLGEMSRQ